MNKIIIIIITIIIIIIIIIIINYNYYKCTVEHTSLFKRHFLFLCCPLSATDAPNSNFVNC